MPQLVSLATFVLVCRRTLGENIFIGGGITPVPQVTLNSVQAYNGSAWTDQFHMGPNTTQTILIPFLGRLYHIGGRDPTNTYLGTAEYFDGGWVGTPYAMPTPRAGARAVVTSDTPPALCVTGGANSGVNFLPVVECFNGTGWTTRPSLTINRTLHGVVQTNQQGMCVVGGLTASSYLNQWECLAPLGTVWLPLTSTLNLGRFGFGTAYFPLGNVPDGMICVAGGIVNFASPAATNTVECTDPSQSWVYVAPMVTARTFAPIVIYQGEACITGGFDGVSLFIPTVECYNMSNNSWNFLPANISVARYHHGAANYDPPTSAPTKAPSQAPTTSMPTLSPTTANPTTGSPVTTNPSNAPTTTGQPTSSQPTSRAPTSNPNTVSPTSKPSSGRPTTAGQTTAPTETLNAASSHSVLLSLLSCLCIAIFLSV